MKRITFFLISILTFLVISTLGVSALEVIPPENTALPITNSMPGSTQAEDTVGKIIAWMIRITAILSIIAITWGGIQMILATGEEEKIKKARYIIIYAFVGLIVAGVAYAVVNFTTSLNFNSFTTTTPVKKNFMW